MKNLFYIFGALWLTFTFNMMQTETNYAIATASNGDINNELLIYNTNGKLLQSIPTQGKGGVPPPIVVGGELAKNDPYLAGINYNSQSVALFKQQAGTFKLIKVLPVASKSVSLAFGHDHLYILGTTTIESHKISGDTLTEQPDGSSHLLVGDGSAAQVGCLLPHHLIISERSNTIELVELRDGVVTDKIKPVHLPPPPGNDTPVRLVTKGDAAYVTIAHSDKVGLVKEGKLITVVSSESEYAPC